MTSVLLNQASISFFDAESLRQRSQEGYYGTVDCSSCKRQNLSQELISTCIDIGQVNLLSSNKFNVGMFYTYPLFEKRYI